MSPSMDPSTLSNNWKKLQQTIQPKSDRPKDSTAVKRRADGDHARRETKRPRTMSTPNYASPSGEPTPAAIGKFVAIDCEMVGTYDLTPLSVPSHNRDTPSDRPKEYSILARASLVNYHGETIYDSYVLPPPGVSISDYRTKWSGITAAHLDGAKTFNRVQKEVDALLQGRILVGHALRNDLAVLGLGHPQRDTRDTSRFHKYREMAATVGVNGKLGKGRTPSLKKLAKEVLGLDVQMGSHGHDSAEDARTAMMLFKREKDGFERDVVKTFGRSVRPGAAVVGRSLDVLNGRGAKDGAHDLNDDDWEDKPERGDALDSEPDGGEDRVGQEEEPSKSIVNKKRKKKKKKSRTKR